MVSERTSNKAVLSRTPASIDAVASEIEAAPAARPLQVHGRDRNDTHCRPHLFGNRVRRLDSDLDYCRAFSRLPGRRVIEICRWRIRDCHHNEYGIPLLINRQQDLLVKSANLPTLLRLRQGGRYVIAVQMPDGTVTSEVFWTELQALVATGVAPGMWPHVQTEVFSLLHCEELPPDAVLFARKNRRGYMLSLVAWGARGIDPLVHRSIEDAKQALARGGPISTRRAGAYKA